MIRPEMSFHISPDRGHMGLLATEVNLLILIVDSTELRNARKEVKPIPNYVCENCCQR